MNRISIEERNSIARKILRAIESETKEKSTLSVTNDPRFRPNEAVEEAFDFESLLQSVVKMIPKKNIKSITDYATGYAIGTIKMHEIKANPASILRTAIAYFYKTRCSHGTFVGMEKLVRREFGQYLTDQEISYLSVEITIEIFADNVLASILELVNPKK